jgi:hypothetical protein
LAVFLGFLMDASDVFAHVPGFNLKVVNLKIKNLMKRVVGSETRKSNRVKNPVVVINLLFVTPRFGGLFIVHHHSSQNSLNEEGYIKEGWIFQAER